MSNPKGKDIRAFVSLLFFARDAAHREHWATDSYAAHVALGEFYEKIIDLADRFVEAYQGQIGRIESFDFLTGEVKDIVSELQKHLGWIALNREDVVSDDDTALQNIIDEIVSVYQEALYKLRFLK